MFRLATVLYADNNYDVKISTVHKKIIESVLLECGKNEFSINQIIDFCQTNYKLVFDENSIQEVISKSSEEFLSNTKNNDTFICLSEKRKLVLNTKIKDKTIDFFISEFIKEYQELTKNTDTKSILYKFLYGVFNSNAQSFKKLIDNKKIEDFSNLETNNYSDKEKEIINNFLQWDNQEKNKTIFDIASYALEYCMLTNKKSTGSIQMENLKNKIFYLDTNIIYRALGINGENRKNRSLTFLKKFAESNAQLIISKSTDTEFKESIKSHINRIKEYNSPRVNSNIYQQFAIKIQPDIFNFYHNWRINKTNASFELFEAYILSLYDNLKKKYKLDVDYIPSYDTKDKKNIEKITQYSSGIYEFKNKERYEGIGSSEVDAANIFLVECKRNGKFVNLFDTKYFLISTDQGLRRWDYQRLDQTPIVLLPSQWLSILLRYVNRTEDDFKSFVSFLNLRNNEVLIDNEKLQIVIAGISELTTDLDTQRNLLNNLIENKFKDILEKNISNEKIFDNSKKYAKTELEKRVEEQGEKINEQNKTIENLSSSNADLKEGQDELSKKIDKHRKDTEKQIKSAIEESNVENKKLTDENKLLKEKLETIQRHRPVFLYIPLILIILVFFLLQILFTNCEWNFVQKLVNYIDKHPSDTTKELLRWIVNIGLGTALVFLIKDTYKRLKNKER